MSWFRRSTESLPTIESTDALIEELDNQLKKARLLVVALRERAKAVESEQREPISQETREAD